MRIYVQYRVFSSRLIGVLLLLLGVIAYLIALSAVLALLFGLAGVLCLTRRWHLVRYPGSTATSKITKTLSLLSIPHDQTDGKISLQAKDVTFRIGGLGPSSLLTVYFGDFERNKSRAIESVVVKALKD